jgi:hypothetical protein
MKLPPTLDHLSRGEFWRYLGETFQMYIRAGVQTDKARECAIRDTRELVERCPC